MPKNEKNEYPVLEVFLRISPYWDFSKTIFQKTYCESKQGGQILPPWGSKDYLFIGLHNDNLNHIEII